MDHAPALTPAAVGDPGPVPADPRWRINLHAADTMLARVLGQVLDDARHGDYLVARFAALIAIDLGSVQLKLAAAIQELEAVRP